MSACLIIMSVLAAGQVDDNTRVQSVASICLEGAEAIPAKEKGVALAEQIITGNASIIALQGIEITHRIAGYPALSGDESRRNSALDTAVDILRDEGTSDWRYELFPPVIGFENRPVSGIAWNACRVGRVDEAYMIDVDRPKKQMWQVQPYAVKFWTSNSGTDFLVISVHMCGNERGVEKGRFTRELEARELGLQLEQLRTAFHGEEDIVIIGNTNITSPDEKAIQVFVKERGFRDTNPGNAITTTKDGGLLPSGRAFLSASKQFEHAQQYVFRPSDPKLHQQKVSRHYMFGIPLRMVNDDD